MTVMNELTAAEVIRAQEAAKEVISLCELGEVVRIFKGANDNTVRAKIEVRSESTAGIFSALNLVKDAAKALKCKTVTLKKNDTQRGGKFASVPRYDAGGWVLGYTAEVIVILP